MSVAPVPPLRLPGVPVVGRDGRRRNVTQLYRVVAGLVPRGRAVRMEIAHDDECPVRGQRAPLYSGGMMDHCTCETVDVTLRLVDPRES
jgi:hypothetical protein